MVKVGRNLAPNAEDCGSSCLRQFCMLMEFGALASHVGSRQSHGQLCRRLL